MVERAIYGKLSGDTDITAYVANRIWPHTTSPNEKVLYPCIIYKLDNRDPGRKYVGQCTLTNRTVDIAVMADTYSDVLAITEIVVDILDNQSGIWGGVTVKGCFHQDESEGIYDLSHRANKLWVSEMTFVIWIDEDA